MRAVRAAGVPDEFAVIDHDPGAETQWDWLELPNPPASWECGKMAHLLVGSLPYSGKWRGVLAEAEDQQVLTITKFPSRDPPRSGNSLPSRSAFSLGAVGARGVPFLVL